MLKRTKYSRLRNDSLTSVEDQPHGMSPQKMELDFDSDLTPPHHGLSTLRDFIPRVANIRLQSPLPLRGPRGHRNTSGDRTMSGQTDRWGPGRDQRICSQPCLHVPLRAGQSLTHVALCCTKRPITLHRMTSLPWTPGCSPCCSQHSCDPCSSAAHESAAVRRANRAVHHDIKYMGSVEVTQSMRNMNFDTRMQVTREAISRICEQASTKAAVKTKRSVDQGSSDVLGHVNLQFSGRRIVLTVSTESVTVTAASSSQKIAHHPVQTISFASGGETDMADYIAYVAKDLTNHRACHILECPQGQACEVINSIGQAFDTRFRQLLLHTPSLVSSNPRAAVRLTRRWSTEETFADQKAKQEGGVSKSCNYYNVIPGKMPPPGGVEDLRTMREEDMHADTQEICLPQPVSVSLYENCSVAEETAAPAADTVGCEVSAGECMPLCESPTQDLIEGESWFHGRLGRKRAESLLTCSGDFLVRESSSASGQYVLSGMDGATVRHLLLIDPHGQVRTQDQVFLSIAHLVRFHMQSQSPILSGGSELRLKQPILQQTD